MCNGQKESVITHLQKVFRFCTTVYKINMQIFAWYVYVIFNRQVEENLVQLFAQVLLCKRLVWVKEKNGKVILPTLLAALVARVNLSP